MARNKYLIYINHKSDFENVILFENSLGHDELAIMLGKGKDTFKVVSAGFWDLDKDGKFTTFGRSVSLNIDSRAGDKEILNYRYNNKF